jgi:hypothetical protein
MTNRPIHTHLHRSTDEETTSVSRRTPDERSVETGYLGRFFGPSGHMVHYVALSCILFSAACMVIFVLAGKGKDFEHYASQLLTLGIGLLGGRALK